jgi:hypothetical protein
MKEMGGMRVRIVLVIVITTMTVVAPVAPAVGAGPVSTTTASATGSPPAQSAGSLEATGTDPQAGAVGDSGVQQVSTAATVSGCTRIESGGVYRLDRDLPGGVGPSGTCIAINASDVTVDGDGYTLAGDGSGTGVGVVRSGLANVTVRDLTVRNVSSGVDLNGTDRAAVQSVAVRATGVDGVSLRGATDAVARDILATPVDGTSPFTDGIDVTDSVDTRVVDVRVRTRTSSFSSGVAAVRSENATLRNVTIAGVDSLTAGFGVWGATTAPPDTTNLTIDGLNIDSYQYGVVLGRATGVTVRNASIRNASRGVTTATIDEEQTGVVESAWITNVSVRDPRVGPAADRPAYLIVDGSNDVIFSDVSTPNATIASVTGANVSLVPVGATPAPPRNVTVGTVGVDNIGASPTASLGFRYDESAVRGSSVSLYERAGSSWRSVPAGAVTLDTASDTATVRVGATGTYGAFADENGSAASLPLGERLFPNGPPASSTGDPPTDVDGDGLLEDIDGNGRFQVTDVIEFVFSLQRGEYAALTPDQVAALDFDGNGRVSFVDVIDLVFKLKSN